MKIDYKKGDVVVIVQISGLPSKFYYGQEVVVASVDTAGVFFAYPNNGYRFFHRIVPKTLFESKLFRMLNDDETV